MLDAALATLLAPALTAAVTLVARRYGPRAGGVVGGFPAIVGPVLFIDLIEHGAPFTARAATGTLLGLVTVSAFAVVYGRLAPRGWRTALAAGCVAAAVAGAALTGLQAGPVVAAAVAAVSLAAAAFLIPRAPAALARDAAAATFGRWDLPGRLVASLVLVATLAVLAGVVGPTAGGVLAALPVLAAVVSVFTHRTDGPVAATAFLRGLLGGLGGFAVFCLLIALLIEPAGGPVAFIAATAGAVVAQLAAVAAGRVGGPDWNPEPTIR